jgi:hypothetical protein
MLKTASLTQRYLIYAFWRCRLECEAGLKRAFFSVVAGHFFADLFDVVKLKTNAKIRLVLFLSSRVNNTVICMPDILNVTTKFI